MTRKISGGVSVITPFYNANRYINEALESIALQKIENLEVVICVDHGSSEPVFENEHNLNVKIIHNTEKENGAGVSRFLAIQKASNRYIAFLDADDLWDSDRLHQHINKMKQNDYVFSFCGFRTFRGTKVYKDYSPFGLATMESFLTKQFTIGCLTVIIDREKIPVIPKNTFPRCNDYKMWYDVLTEVERMGLKWGYIQECLASRRLHNSNLTKSKFKSVIAMLYFYQSLELDKFSIFRLFCKNVANTIKRKIKFG